MINTEIFKSLKYIQKTWNQIQAGHYEVCTDSRLLQSKQIFIAIRGEKFDAFSFLDKVLEKNPVAIIFHDEIDREVIVKNLSLKHPETFFISTIDTILITQELARLHVEQWQKKSSTNKVIGISGSNGKTTHKEMLFHYLNNLHPGQVIKTEKNNNNHLGVPLTIFQIKPSTEYAVVEFGSNHPGEIKVVCDIALPQLGVVTNIGATHLEFFGTTENVFIEESYLYWSIQKTTNNSGIFFQNVDDDYLRKLPKNVNTISFGKKNADARFEFFHDHVFIYYKDQNYKLENQNIIGEHNFHNLAVCFLIVLHLHPTKAHELVELASKFTPRDNRSMWITYKNKKVFLDAYNANPSSMQVSLEGFVQYCQKANIPLESTYFILGDMNELGSNGETFHEEIGAWLKSHGVKNVSFVGRYGKFYEKGFGGGHLEMNSVLFKELHWQKIFQSHQTFFFKGSRSLQLESILDIKDH